MYQPSEVSQTWRPGFVPGYVSESTGSYSSPSDHVPVASGDERLIDSALQGRTDAFGELVGPLMGSLTRFARLRLGNNAEAEDVVQQAVLQAFDNLAQFRREASFRTWLSKITSNEVMHIRRRKAIAPTRPFPATLADKLADPSCPPDLQIQRRQERDRLHRALTRLPEKYRAIIQLRDLHELSIAATARSLSLTVGAVKTRHHRARKLLLRSLGSHH